VTCLAGACFLANMQGSRIWHVSHLVANVYKNWKIWVSFASCRWFIGWDQSWQMWKMLFLQKWQRCFCCRGHI